MALVPVALEAQIVALFSEMSERTGDPAAAQQYFAQQLSTILTNYIKSATITVATTGTAAAQTGTGVIT